MHMSNCEEPKDVITIVNRNSQGQLVNLLVFVLVVSPAKVPLGLKVPFSAAWNKAELKSSIFTTVYGVYNGG